MKITTKFDLGYDFWVPRVFSCHNTLTLVEHGEEWNRVETTLEISARHKVVVEIEVRVKGDIASTVYHCRDADRDGSFPLRYPPDDLILRTEKAALNFARNWRESEGKEYYGTGLDSEWEDADDGEEDSE